MRTRTATRAAARNIARTLTQAAPVGAPASSLRVVRSVAVTRRHYSTRLVAGVNEQAAGRRGATGHGPTAGGGRGAEGPIGWCRARGLPVRLADDGSRHPLKLAAVLRE